MIRFFISFFYFLFIFLIFQMLTLNTVEIPVCPMKLLKGVEYDDTEMSTHLFSCKLGKGIYRFAYSRLF